MQPICRKTIEKEKTVTLSIDAFPTENEENLFQHIWLNLKDEPKKAVKNVLKGLLPERYLLFLLEESEIDHSMTFSQLSKDKLRQFVRLVKDFRFEANGTLPIEKAFVTGGGVSIKEIDPKTMASKLMNGLYFCGEILDIHGYTGGYNITAALVTGRLAGLHASRYVEKSEPIS